MKDKGETFKLYLGFKTDPPDKFTNETVFGALQEARLSTEWEVLDYKGKEVRVLEVTPEFVKSLYRSEVRMGTKLMVEVYARKNYTLQKYRLLESDISKRAKYGRYKKK